MGGMLITRVYCSKMRRVRASRSEREIDSKTVVTITVNFYGSIKNKTFKF